MKVALIYNQFYSSDGNNLMIGGIETYIRYLSKLMIKLDHTPIVYQKADKDFAKYYCGFKVQGYKCKTVKELYTRVRHEISKDDLIIFMGDQFSVNVAKEDNVILIQHGISWDKPYPKAKIINLFRRAKMIIKAILAFNNAKYRVCVDYNFYNWYKTFCVNRTPNNIFIIPNFVETFISQKELESKLEINNKNINIIFARRFYDFRGCIIFAKAMRNILNTNHNINLTIAGEGPCEQEIKSILHPASNVNYIRYLPEQSFDIHVDKDIAVIPTIGSEGTSLSLLEAMGAGCLTVSTPVGGMSNIVIDNYNGIFSMPDEISLENAIRKAISKLNDKKIRFNSVKTAKDGFSLEKWESSWTHVINIIINRRIQ